MPLLRIAAFVHSLFKSRRQLTLENLAHRQQLAMLRLSVKRPQVSTAGRLFWILFSKNVDGWRGQACVATDHQGELKVRYPKSLIATVAALLVAIATHSTGETSGAPADAEPSLSSVAHRSGATLDALVREAGLDADALAGQLRHEAQASVEQGRANIFCDVHQRYENATARQSK